MDCCQMNLAIPSRISRPETRVPPASSLTSTRDYSDTDRAGEKDAKSTSSSLLTMASMLISWYSKQQSTVALSTAETEYIAGATAVATLHYWEESWLLSLFYTDPSLLSPAYHVLAAPLAFCSSTCPRKLPGRRGLDACCGAQRHLADFGPSVRGQWSRGTSALWRLTGCVREVDAGDCIPREVLERRLNRHVAGDDGYGGVRLRRGHQLVDQFGQARRLDRGWTCPHRLERGSIRMDVNAAFVDATYEKVKASPTYQEHFQDKKVIVVLDNAPAPRSCCRPRRSRTAPPGSLFAYVQPDRGMLQCTQGTHQGGPRFVA
ncbi:hypothetical protein ON010_g12415 [Phytophthora cinnamomi]|nr:hypothetical protein ON010_g12415 [Phytophthora cinnamomi]